MGRSIGAEENELIRGRADVVAHDPSVADYRATSPRYAQGGKPAA